MLALAGAASCTASPDFENIYSRGQAPRVVCSESIDDSVHIPLDQILSWIERAKHDGTTLHLYTHRPGETIQVATLEAVLAGAVEHGVAFTTYDQLDRAAPGSLALSFDDDNLDSWTAIRPLLARYHARVTFFISGFLDLAEPQRAELRQLADDGYDIEYHSTHHFNAAEYAGEHGLEGYIADDITPALEAMLAAGYPISVFAYPHGDRNQSLDDALAPYFTHLRANHSRCPR